MKDLLRTASVDKRVAMALIEDPESFAKLYNLNKAQIAGLKDIGSKLGRGIGKVATDITYE
jgi:ribosomal protein S17E